MIARPAWILGLLAAGFCLPAFAQGTAFTYQGRLSDSGSPASGMYDLRFAIYDSTNSPGVPVAGPITNAPVAATNGLFTVVLDFGAGVFTGADRWLEIGVRTNGPGVAGFTVLAPRQKLTATPYAIAAGNLTGTVASSQLTGTISSNLIGSGSITATMLASGAVGSNQLADGAVTASKIGTVPRWFPLPKIPNPTPEDLDSFGFSGAVLEGDLLLIGAGGDDTGAADAGAAYLFDTNGVLLTTFANPTPSSGDQFGISVAGLGNNRVIIGAAANAAYLFSISGALVATLTNPMPTLLEGFGSPVAGLGDDRVLVGALANDTGAPRAGVAYLFRANGTLLNTFTNPTPADSDYFGGAIATVGNDRVLIGAYQDDTGATDAGAAYLFSTNGGLLVTFTNPTPAAQDIFGWAMTAVGSDHVLISAFGDDTAGPGAGAAYLFRTNGALVTTFTEPATGYEFGRSVVAVGDDRVLIGAAGAMYLFGTNGTLLTAVPGPDPGAADGFGAAVGMIGSDRFFGTAPDAVAGGAAYLLSFETYTPGVVADGVNGGSIDTAALADGAVTPLKLDSTIGVWTRADTNVYRLAGRVGIGTAAPGFTLHVNGSAAKPGGGSWSTTSDARLKKNIHPLAGALDKLLALRGVSFEYTDPEGIHELSGERMGLIAQEVERVFPDWVESGPDGYQRVTVRGLEALVVESLRELQQQKNADIRDLNRRLTDELDRKETEITGLKQRLEALEQAIHHPH